MAEMIIDAPKITVGVKIRLPRFYGLRMKALLWVFRLAQYVAPPGVLVEVLPIKVEGDMVRFEGDTAEGGKIVLCEYPEGYILRHHGEVVWREWERK